MVAKTLFACKSAGNEYRVAEWSSQGQPARFTLRVRSAGTNSVSERGLRQPGYGAKYFGNGSLAQLSFASKDGRLLVFTRSGATRDDAGDYHSGDFQDGIVIWSGLAAPQVVLCDAPYDSDLAWADFDKRFPKAVLVDLDELVPPT